MMLRYLQQGELRVEIETVGFIIHATGYSWKLPSMNRSFLPIGLLTFLFCQTALAAVVDVDVTIKSVDATARTISVTYEVNSVDNTIDLDVSRKAEIMLNGKATTLNSIKPTQKATISYEKEFQIVTKIEATGIETDSIQDVFRMTLQLSEFGDGNFRIEKTSKPPEDDFSGTPFKFSHWPHTKATKGQDGMFRLVHDFKDADELTALTWNKENLTVDKDSGTMIFASQSLPEGYAVKKGAVFCYGKKLRLPITVVCDIANQGGGLFAIHVYNQKLGLLNCTVLSKETNLDGPFDVVVGWNDLGKGEKQNITNLCDVKGIALDQPFDKQFRLPLPNAKIGESFLLDLIKGMGDEPTTVSRLEVRGRVAPMFGMELGEKGGMVFAKKVQSNKLAEKAGFQVGDVLLIINGKKPQTMQEAVDMMAQIPVGDDAVFTIKRGTETIKLQVTAE
jgi:hypothetical protein